MALISEVMGTCVAPSAGIVLSTFGGSSSLLPSAVSKRLFVIQLLPLCSRF